MTPAAIRTVAQLRQEFYSLFALAINAPVNITSGSSSTSNPSMAFWLDQRQRLNCLYIYAYTAPDELIPQRPLVFQVAINKRIGTPTTSIRGKLCGEPNRSWTFELTLLPEEILDFLPWIVSLVKAYDSSLTPLLPEPPYPLQYSKSDVMLSHSAQTYSAGGKLAQSRAEQSVLLPIK